MGHAAEHFWWLMPSGRLLLHEIHLRQSELGRHGTVGEGLSTQKNERNAASARWEFLYLEQKTSADEYTKKDSAHTVPTQCPHSAHTVPT